MSQIVNVPVWLAALLLFDEPLPPHAATASAALIPMTPIHVFRKFIPGLIPLSIRMRRRSARVVVAFLCPRSSDRAPRGAGRAPVAASLQYEVGDQAIAVAAIDGADELDDPP